MTTCSVLSENFMKTKIIFCLLLFIGLSAHAQGELLVKSFLPSVNDLSARTNLRVDGNGRPCALVKVIFAEKNATFECGNLASMIVGDVSFHTNEYWVYLVAGQGGAKHLMVKHPKYPTVDVVFEDYGFKTLEALSTYTLVVTSPRKLSRFKPKRFYGEVEGHFGMMNSVGTCIGGYFYNVNLELTYHYGFIKSDEIYWINGISTDGEIPSSYKYTPSYMGARIGYGVNVGERFCITPQIGFGAVSLMGKEYQIGETTPGAHKGFAIDASVGAKVDYLFSKHFGVYVAPEYTFAIKKSDLFERVSSVSSKVRNFGTGFNVRIGIFVTL